MTPRHFFSHHLWKRFRAVALPYWREDEKRRAWGLLALLVLLLLGQTRFAVLLNEQTGEFTSALAARDEARFWHSIRYTVVVLALAVPNYAFYFYVRDTLGIHWRRWLTRRFLERYFGHRRFYELNANALIDNPDQRIAEDINTFTSRSLYFLLIFIGAFLQLVAFSTVLWSISHELVYVLVVYATSGTLITVGVFGSPLMRLNFQQLRREADFRYSLVRVRENAESIAFYRGEPQELHHVMHYFGAAFSNFKELVRRQLGLNFFQYAYSLLNIVLPSAIVASQVLSGELEVGRAVQAAGAFAAVLGAISVVVENFENLSRFAAGIERIDTLAHALLDAPGAPSDTPRIRSADAPNLALEHLTLHTPGYERVLVRELSLRLVPGQGLLIVGDSGCGKTSLARAIAGLWRAGSGTIHRPPADELVFLPQQPYMQPGSLRSQLLYPHNNGFTLPDARLLELLERVNLPDLAGRFGGLDAEHDWEKVLSVGEQQRLAFARVLLTRPRYAILDEATSALDNTNEAALYRQLMESGTTLISIAHRSALLKYHTQVLELTGDGGWQLHDARAFRFRQ